MKKINKTERNRIKNIIEKEFDVWNYHLHVKEFGCEYELCDILKNPSLGCGHLSLNEIKEIFEEMAMEAEELRDTGLYEETPEADMPYSWRKSKRIGAENMVVENLKTRGLIKQGINLELDGRKTPYLGIDVTADALHVGHLLPLMAMTHFIANGNNVIFLLGGATTFIGDPSCKSKARAALTEEEIYNNTWDIKFFLINWVLKIFSSEERKFNLVDDCGFEIICLYDFLKEDDINFIKENSGCTAGVCLRHKNQVIRILNNSDWYFPDDTQGFGTNYFDFITRFGQHFSVNDMLKLSSIGARLEQQEHMSLAEFNYTFMQAYDFYHLKKIYQCDLQIGGADQWDNIAQGVEFCRKLCFDVGGLTTPLLLTKDGSKMGKTEDFTVWLDESKTSVFNYWQFFRNCRDEDVENWIKWFTFIDYCNCEFCEMDINTKKYNLALHATTILYGAKVAKEVIIKVEKLKIFSSNDVILNFLDEF